MALVKSIKNVLTSFRVLMPILESLITSKCTVKDLFNFATEVIKQDSSNLMGSTDIVHFLLTFPL